MASRSAAELAKEVEAQGEKVRKLKESTKAAGATDASKAELNKEVEKLKELKKQLEAAGGAPAGAAAPAAAAAAAAAAPAKVQTPEEKHREAFDNLLIRKMFVVPAFEIYGGVAGLYDFGPPGSALMHNIQAVWRRHFVLEESMLEVSCTSMTPEPVLVTSGHVAKFEDFMVRDEKTGEALRADHLLEAHVDKLLENAALPAADRARLLEVRAKADAYSLEDLDRQLKELKVLSPAGNPVTAPYPFNLMFKTLIGPSGKLVGYLRPETAQGIFVNFGRLLEYNSGRLPFAAAQIGPAFRNEIAPRSGLLRVREFALAEIEHFVDPNNKAHPRFPEVAGNRINVLPRALQGGETVFETVTVGDAVKARTIANETLAYFMARTQLFLVSIGVDPRRLRFRQHQADEMAHYAEDCWDAEIKTTYGWVECVGHADRSCYDLKAHSEATGRNLVARVNYDPPRQVRRVHLTVNGQAMGRALKKGQEAVKKELERQCRETPEALLELSDRLAAGPVELRTCDETFTLQPGMFSAKWVDETVTGETFHPTVIEPSFGLGRILYCVLEHSFGLERRGQEERAVLRLPPLVAPTKVAVLPLTSADDLERAAAGINTRMLQRGLSTRLDTTKVSIGKKYARTEEIGVPFAVTVDPEVLTKKRVTVRDVNTTRQVYVAADAVVDLVADLVAGTRTWDQVWSTHEQVVRNEESEE